MEQKPLKLYTSGDDFLHHLLLSLKRAKSTIDIEYYIISHDKVGRRLFEALKEAHKRAVKIRVLLDGWGCNESLPVLIDWANQIGFELKVYHPPLWRHEALPSPGHLFKINQRTHRKLVIIDQNVAFTGSINLTPEHFSEYSGTKAWLDLGLTLTGELASEIQSVFEASWEQEGEDGPSEATLKNLPHLQSPVRANQTKRRRYRLYCDLIERLETAKQRIVIVGPYFVPTRRICHALKKAAKRGVKVQIILPYESDLRLFPWFNFFGVRELIRFGVRFYEYLPTILHSKLTIIDDFFLLGSSNWNTRSFYHDRELDIEIREVQVQQQLTDFLIKTINSSRLISYRAAKTRFASDFWARPFFYFLKYWI